MNTKFANLALAAGLTCIQPLVGGVKPRVVLAIYEGVNHPVVNVIGQQAVILVEDQEIRLPRHQKFEMMPFGDFGNGTAEFGEIREVGDLKAPRSEILLSGSLIPDRPINDPYIVVFSDLGGGYVFEKLPDLKPQRRTDFDLKFLTGYGRSKYSIFLFSNGREIVTNRIKANPLDALFSLDSSGDRSAKAVLRVPPQYPINLRSSGISGTVLVEISVDKWGCVVDVEAASATHAAFEESALKAVRDWLFNPAVKDGIPVPQKVRQSIPFNLYHKRRGKQRNRRQT